MFGFLKRLFAGSPTPSPQPVHRPATLFMSALIPTLGASEAVLRDLPIQYHEYHIPKRTGGSRRILAPSPELKAIQRRLLRRVLEWLRVHPCATGFEHGHSIVTNARPHVGQELVIKLDLKDFFGSTSAARVERWFRHIGWEDEAAKVLTRLCTYEGSLPQGAPTSPRLSNLVNVKLDARLAELAAVNGMSYSRYADDLTFSGPARTPRPSTNPKTLEPGDAKPVRVNSIIAKVKQVVAEEGYTLHTAKKLRIARRHDRQVVTGLVVNEKVQLPRSTRQRLRAIRHRLATTGHATLTPQQLAGWDALQHMIKSSA